MSRDTNNEEKQAVSSEHPGTDRNKDHVKILIEVDKEDADVLYKEAELLLKTADQTKEMVIYNRDQLKQNVTCMSKPYPFKRFDAAHRYQENSILDVTETGPKDYIQPCHEFKAFTNTPEKYQTEKYTYEVIRFAAACMNSRTNGTIHFGVSDKPHGQIMGVIVKKEDDFTQGQTTAVNNHFKQMSEIVKRCIMPPRFVEVLKADMTSAGKCVIEVDIEPSFIVCEDHYFNTYNLGKDPRSAGEKGSFFIRDGSNTKDLKASTKAEEYDAYIANMSELSKLRKDAEEKHLTEVKNSVQGLKLCEMLTGGTHSLDKSHFSWYVVVANKSHPVQLENLKFLTYMNLMAVLDFDPESAENGLNKLFKRNRETNSHLPAEYEITQTVDNTAEKLKLTNKTSWVFCNGGFNDENPSDAQKWLTEKGSSVRHPVYFLCRKDVLPSKKFLIIFLLLNQVTDGNDPMLETFSMFLQELKGTNQILCICDNETTFNLWKDLIMGRYGVDISKRCISELSFTEINGTVLSLWSENRKSDRFLPSVGGSKVVLSKKIEDTVLSKKTEDTVLSKKIEDTVLSKKIEDTVLSKKIEDTLDLLSILCVNQCDGGNEDKQQHEETFYRGGKVSWWNFYFSEQPGSTPFIRRDQFEYIIDCAIPEKFNMKRACVIFNIFHPKGCGGTTLAMHVLWTLKNKFRCAVLMDRTDDFTKVSQQVVKLLTYEAKAQQTRLPVLLLIDVFENISDVETLQKKIEEEIQKEFFFCESLQVILLHCVNAESHEEIQGTNDYIFLRKKLSDKEKKLFDEKLNEFKRTYPNTDTNTFHGFMYLQTNFSQEYILGVVKNTLKGFDFQHKHAQLFAVLVLLNVYCKNTLLSVSACEEFLHLKTTENSQSCKGEDGFKEFSDLLTRCTAASKRVFESMRVINSCVAQHCLEELAASHGVTKADIMDTLLTTFLGYDCFLGKQKLMQDVHSMIVKRQHSTKDESLYSPLIHDIMEETPGREENILHNAAKVYKKDAIIFQLLARYYLTKNDFKKACDWAKKAKDHSKDNSNICDTVAQVLMSELKYEFQQDRDDPIKPDRLEMYLTLAQSASDACRETQEAADKEAQLQRPRDSSTYNTAGHLSELQVAVKVIEILKKTPLFNSDDRLLGQVLSGQIKIEDLAKQHPRYREYCDVLEKHMCYLCNIKTTTDKLFKLLEQMIRLAAPFLAVRLNQQKEQGKRVFSKIFSP